MRRWILATLWLALVACDDEVEGYTQGYETGRADGTHLGYEEGRKAGFRKGLDEGREAGRYEGRVAGRNEAVARWTPLGFGLGAVLGLGLVGVLTRRQVRAALERRRIEKRLAGHRARVPEHLDADLVRRLDGVLDRVATLEAELGAETTAPLVRAAVDLHTLLHRLRASQNAVATPDPARIQALEAQLEGADADTRPAVEDALTALRRKRDALHRSAAHAERCTLQLEALDGVLDHLRLGAANVDAAGRDALVSRLGGEVAEAVDQMERAVATASRELGEI